MGQNTEKSEMRWASLTFYVGGYIRYLLEKFGYHLDEGMVFVADNDMQAREFVRLYCGGLRTNGKVVRTWKCRRQYPDNFEVGFFLLQRQSKEEDIIEFLSENKFFPVVICGGILPEYLRENRYIFRLRQEDLNEISNKEWWKENEKLRKFIIQNPLKLCENFRRLERLNAVASYDGPHELKQIFCFLVGVATTYAEYLKETESEEREMNFKANYVEESKRRLKQVLEFGSGEDTTIRFSELVWEYLTVHNNTFLVEGDEIGSRELKVLKDERIILFDTEYYFFPPKLVTDICAPLLQNISEPELKKRLKTEGILYCNSADYTTKKTITTVYGEKMRPRFLWIHKEALLSEDNLRLEDVFLKE